MDDIRTKTNQNIIVIICCGNIEILNILRIYRNLKNS